MSSWHDGIAKPFGTKDSSARISDGEADQRAICLIEIERVEMTLQLLGRARRNAVNAGSDNLELFASGRGSRHEHQRTRLKRGVELDDIGCSFQLATNWQSDNWRLQLLPLAVW